MSDMLVVFVKWPQPGRVKTRLAEEIGAERAAGIYRALATATLAEARTGWPVRDLRVAFDPPENAAEFPGWLGRDLRFVEQGEGDLGARLSRVSDRLFAEGADTVTIVGSDCPLLSGRLLAMARAAVEDGNFVLGPAADGGYWLIGLPRRAPELFTDVPWSTDQVFTRTRARLEEREEPCALLPVLTDVDRAADVPAWMLAEGGGRA